MTWRAEEDVRWPYAQEYVRRGWLIFVLGKNKTPLPNCVDCARADWHHDRQKCQCLTCHGFYAATGNLERIQSMLTKHDGLLALRCGPESGVLVIDFEATNEPGEPTGLDVAEQWQQWTGEAWELPDTLRARTAGGGLHLFYDYPAGPPIPMRNRILPSTDLKADKGYVALPCGLDARHWTNWFLFPGDPQASLASLPNAGVDWLRNARGRRARRNSAGQPTVVEGYDYHRCLADGPHHGERDEFWNDHLFRCRKADIPKDRMLGLAGDTWARFGGDTDIEDPFPFEWIAYKIERVWLTVEPDIVNDKRQAWAQREKELRGTGEANVPTLDEHRERYVTWGHVKTIANPGRTQL